MPEDGMIGWHHRLNGHEFEQTPGESEGQGPPDSPVPGIFNARTMERVAISFSNAGK